MNETCEEDDQRLTRGRMLECEQTLCACADDIQQHLITHLCMQTEDHLRDEHAHIFYCSLLQIPAEQLGSGVKSLTHQIRFGSNHRTAGTNERSNGRGQ